MNNTEEGNVNSQKNKVEFETKSVSIKLTKKTRQMLDYIQDNTQMSMSNIIRLAISKYYNELKRQEVKNDI